jgi:hypothetical protein
VRVTHDDASFSLKKTFIRRGLFYAILTYFFVVVWFCETRRPVNFLRGRVGPGRIYLGKKLAAMVSVKDVLSFLRGNVVGLP